LHNQLINNINGCLTLPFLYGKFKSFMWPYLAPPQVHHLHVRFNIRLAYIGRDRGLQIVLPKCNGIPFSFFQPWGQYKAIKFSIY
jgi:hypothetical protein